MWAALAWARARAIRRAAAGAALPRLRGADHLPAPADRGDDRPPFHAGTVARRADGGIRGAGRLHDGAAPHPADRLAEPPDLPAHDLRRHPAGARLRGARLARAA